MECLSCKVEIDPKWKHALENNVCPFCGDNVMPEDLKNYIISLRSTLDIFKEKYSNQLDDLLFSNYKYVRTDSPRMKQFIPEPKVIYNSIPDQTREDDSDSDESAEEKDSSVVAVQDPEVTSKFFKNAGASRHAARTEELKNLVSQIKTNNPKLSALVKQGSAEDMSDEEFMESEGANSSISTPYDDEDIPPAVLAFAGQSGKNNPGYNPKDMLRLQQLQQRTAQSRKNVVNGTGGKGSFSRG
jgi:hypothetical protein